MTNPVASQQPAPIPEEEMIALKSKLYSEWIDAPGDNDDFDWFLIERVARLDGLARDYRAVVARHPGGFPEGRLGEIDAALGMPGREKP
jgi:hypothetical protein